MRQFPSGATRDDDAMKPDYEGYLSPLVLAEFGRYMTRHRVQADGKIRPSDNWQLGMPRDAYMKSLLRHVIELWQLHRAGLRVPLLEGDRARMDEALCAILFNVQGYLHERLLDDVAVQPEEHGGEA